MACSPDAQSLPRPKSLPSGSWGMHTSAQPWDIKPTATKAISCRREAKQNTVSLQQAVSAPHARWLALVLSKPSMFSHAYSSARYVVGTSDPRSRHSLRRCTAAHSKCHQPPSSRQRGAKHPGKTLCSTVLCRRNHVAFAGAACDTSLSGMIGAYQLRAGEHEQDSLVAARAEDTCRLVRIVRQDPLDDCASPTPHALRDSFCAHQRATEVRWPWTSLAACCHRKHVDFCSPSSTQDTCARTRDAF